MPATKKPGSVERGLVSVSSDGKSFAVKFPFTLRLLRPLAAGDRTFDVDYHVTCVKADKLGYHITRDGIEAVIPVSHAEPAHRVVNGVSYSTRTPDKVVRILERCRRDDTLIFVRLGDRETGRDWMEESFCWGRIGRSTGSIKIPLLVAPKQYGAPGLSDDGIVAIFAMADPDWEDSASAVPILQPLYKHPKYHVPPMRLDKAITPGYVCGAYDEQGGNHAQFKTWREGHLWMANIACLDK